MSKVLIAFGSTSGNTEVVSDWIFDVFLEKGHETDLVNCMDLTADGLANDYDMVVFGCPTYGCDVIEIQEDFDVILKDFDNAGLSGKKVAIFGLGDDVYPHFCGAVDDIEEKAKACGAILSIPSLKINDPCDDHKDEILVWAAKAAAAV